VKIGENNGNWDFQKFMVCSMIPMEIQISRQKIEENRKDD
jgi:hypothetical protein